MSEIIVRKKFNSLVYTEKFKNQKNGVLFRIINYNVDKLLNNSLKNYLLYTEQRL